MRWRSGFPACLSALAAAVVLTVAKGQPSSTPSVLTGAYTEEQAVRGQQLYYSQCLSCHGEDMAGLDQAPPLAGPQFGAVWDGEPLAALVERIDTMPPTAPGSLSRDDSVALLAYMLWYNGLPIGEAPLATESSSLAKMAFLSPLANE